MLFLIWMKQWSLMKEFTGLSPKSTTPQPSTVWWAATAGGTDGETPMLLEDGGATWIPLIGFESIFFVAGDCDLLGVSDHTPVDFTYYPNPVTEILTIESQVEIRSVRVYNLLGQEIKNFYAIQNGEIALNDLMSGIYLVKATFEDGREETFKVVKK